MAESCIVLTTIGSREEADRLAHALVERRLAACVNIVPGVESVFWWQGKVDTGSELLLVIKTTRAGYPDLEAAIAELHPYDLPECIQVPITAGSAAYLNWIQEAVQ